MRNSCRRKSHCAAFALVSHKAGWHIHGSYYNMPVTDFKHYDFYKHKHYYFLSRIDRWDWIFIDNREVYKKWRKAMPYEMYNLNHDY